MNITAAYLEFEILYHRDIRDSAITQEDKRWKQGQIDLLQRMVNDIDGIYQSSAVEILMKNMKDMEYERTNYKNCY